MQNTDRWGAYELSVLDCANEHGNLSLDDAMELCRVHGTTFGELLDGGFTGLLLNATALLEVLGY